MHPRTLALAALIPTACVDRMLSPRECDDGVLVQGEACFGDDTELLTVPFTPIALRAAPFDGDDTPDLLITGVDATGLVVGALSRNETSGVLGALQDAGVSGCSAHPALGNANGDGAIDLLVDACDDTMMVFLAEPTGHFAPPIAVDTDVTTLTSGIVDVDADGVTDVIALGLAGTSVALTWSRGDGAGGYGPPIGTFVGTVGAVDQPHSFSVGLLDDDDLPDVVLSHPDPDQPPRFVRGTGAAFAEPIPWDELPAARGVGVLDIDGDGDTELLVVRGDPMTFEAWSGRFGALDRLGSTEFAITATRITTAGDVDGDGALDLVFFEPTATDVDVWLGDGEGEWTFAADVEVGANVDQLAVVDLDDDGAAELVAGTFAAGGITIVRSSP
jgi:hypothetical protein